MKSTMDNGQSTNLFGEIDSKKLKTVPGFCAWRHLSQRDADKLSIYMATKAAKGLVYRRATRSKKYPAVRWSYLVPDLEEALREIHREGERYLILDEEDAPSKPATIVVPGIFVRVWRWLFGYKVRKEGGV